MDVKRDVSSFSVPPRRSPVLLGSAVLRTPSAALPGRFLRSQKETSPLGGWRGLNTRTKSSSEGEDICQLDPAPVARHKPHWLKGPNWDPSLASYKQWKWQEVCPPLRGNGVCPREGDGHQEGTPSPSGPAPSLCRRPGEDPLSTFLYSVCPLSLHYLSPQCLPENNLINSLRPSSKASFSNIIFPDSLIKFNFSLLQYSHNTMFKLLYLP